jgi:translation initiation factor IF-1
LCNHNVRIVLKVNHNVRIVLKVNHNVRIVPKDNHNVRIVPKDNHNVRIVPKDNHNVRIVPKVNQKIVGTKTPLIPLTNINMPVYLLWKLGERRVLQTLFVLCFSFGTILTL